MTPVTESDQGWLETRRSWQLKKPQKHKGTCRDGYFKSDGLFLALKDLSTMIKMGKVESEAQRMARHQCHPHACLNEGLQILLEGNSDYVSIYTYKVRLLSVSLCTS